MDTHCGWGALCTPPSACGGRTVYVAFARFSMFRFNASAVPAPVETVNGFDNFQHSSTELPFCVTTAVNCRKVSFAAGTDAMSSLGKASTDVAATSDRAMLHCMLFTSWCYEDDELGCWY
jgi:hypothetical protein